MRGVEREGMDEEEWRVKGYMRRGGGVHEEGWRVKGYIRRDGGVHEERWRVKEICGGVHEEGWRVKGICGGVEGCMRRGGVTQYGTKHLNMTMYRVYVTPSALTRWLVWCRRGR